MKILARGMLLLPALCITGAQTASAVSEERLDVVQANLAEIQSNVEQLPPVAEAAVSGSSESAAFLGARFPGLRAGLADARPLAPRPPGALAPLVASDPVTDRRFSQFAGFTQSESSTAWCGSNAVIAYNDTGSFLETLIETLGGISFIGFSRSGNMNLASPTFTDKAFVPPGADPANTLIGDPVVVCTNASTFYLAGVFSQAVANASSITVSKSTNGGATFGDPVPAATKDAATHFLDKPWLARDRSTNALHVTYTDFDSSLDLLGTCAGDFRTAIELVSSTDGGQTWTSPTVIEEVCGQELVHGSQVAVGPNSTVYVAWEFIDADGITRFQRVASSANSYTPVEVAAVNCVGSCTGGVFDGDPGLLRGFFRAGREFPSLAVNPNNGQVFVTWHNARVTRDDAFSVNGYGFADVVVSKSTDGGLNWSSPVRVNNNAETTNTDSDQYQPGIAVNNANGIAICWYDRRGQGFTTNSGFDRYCATSTDGGATWPQSRRNSGGPFAPTGGQDVLLNPLYFGDYDSVTTDQTGVLPNKFASAWSQTKNGNPDIQAIKF
jgi:hypothetical protein